MPLLNRLLDESSDAITKIEDFTKERHTGSPEQRIADLEELVKVQHTALWDIHAYLHDIRRELVSRGAVEDDL